MPIEFDEDTYKTERFRGVDSLNKTNHSSNKFSSFLIRKDIVKNEKQANIFLFVISILFFIASIFFLKDNFSTPKTVIKEFKNLKIKN